MEGQGEILRIEDKPAHGTRDLTIDENSHLITDEVFQSLPEPYRVGRYGYSPNKVALTFDDGPDPDWTPKILDVLKQKHATATFFLIGIQTDKFSSIAKRIYREGNTIGNHTFTHPNLGELPASLVTLEINATQRLFEALTGRSMRLFRAPFLGDAEPTTSDEIVPIEIAQSMGYVSVGLHVDPNDWLRPSADVIVDRVFAAAKASSAAVASLWRGVSQAGRGVLRRAGLVAIPGLRFSSVAGVLTYAGHPASVARAHASR